MSSNTFRILNLIRMRFALLFLSTFLGEVTLRAQSTNTLIADPFNPGARNTVFALAVQPDGKFLVAGQFTQIGPAPQKYIARLNPDGSLDASFNTNVDDTVFAIALQTDGKILIGGDFEFVNGIRRNSVARLSSTGALDTTFNGGDLDRCRALSVQVDGNILVGGIPYLTRLLPSGAPDSSFNLSSSLSSGQSIYALALQSDGKILAGGLLVATPSFGLARINSDGSQDTTFAPFFDLPVRTITVQPDQRILVGGDFRTVNGDPNPFLSRLLPSGAPDTTMANLIQSVGLGNTPEGFFGSVYSIALLPSGGFMAAGPVRFISGQNARDHLARFSADGALDSTFDAKLNRTVNQVINAPGDRLLVGGEFTTITGVARARIARLVSDVPTATVNVASTGTSIPEGDTSFTLDINLSSPLSVPFTVALSITGSATAGKDYIRPESTIRFEPGEVTRTITFPLIDDILIEPDETVVITLAEPPDPAVTRTTPFAAVFTLKSDEVAAQIISDPVSQIAATGTSVSFSSNASGTPSPTIEWRRNGTRIAGATSTALTLPSVTLSDAGSYSMKATVSNTSDLSQAASLTVVDQAPLTQPGATSATATLRVFFASSERPTFKWFRNGVAVTDVANKISGSLSSSLVIRNLALTDSDKYTCEVTTSAGSLDGAEISLVVYDSVPEILNSSPPLVIPTARVSELISFPMPIDPDPLKTPTKFTVTGLPSGLIFDPATGRIFGRAIKPGTYDNIRITPSNAKGKGSQVSATMQVLPLDSSLIGSYVGNVARNSSVNGTLGGSISLTVSTTGQCSGTLRSAGSTFRFTGALDTSATVTDSSLFIKIARSKPLPAIVLDLDFDLTSTTITGDLKEDGLIPTASISGHLCLPAASNRQGYQTLTFDLADPSDVGVESIPQGTGFLSFTVPASGSVTMRGSLPDGTAITLSSRISPTGGLPVYLPLYNATGSLLAEINVSNDLDRTVTGSLSWFRDLQSSSQRSYRFGFGPIAYSATGGAYIPPVAGIPVMNLPSTLLNARLTFLEGLVSTAVVSPNITFTLGSSASGVFPTLASGNNPNRVSMAVVRSTGMFSGQFSLTNPLSASKNLSRIAKFKGIIARDGSLSSGGGFFTLPKLPSPLTAPANTTDILSGQVNLLPAP
jgi:uncharacterized delta-60 repeat protein